MKILHVNYSKSGGSGEVARVLVESQINHLNYDSVLLFKSNRSLRFEPLIDLNVLVRTFFDNFIIRKYSALQFFSLFRNRNDGKTKKEILRNKGTVHLHWINGILDYNFISNLSKNKKIVWTLHDMEFITGGCHYALGCTNFVINCEKCPIVRRGFRSFVNKNYKMKFLNKNWNRVSFVVPSLWMKKMFHENKYLKDVNVEVIYNPVSEVFFNEYNKTKSQGRYLNSENNLIIGFASAWIANPQKGYRKILQILSEVQPLVQKDLIFVTVGGGWLKEKLVDGLKVIHLGEISDKKKLAETFASFDINITFSVGESFGMTVAETMALGIPSLVMNSSASSELIIDKKTGWICETHSDVKEILINICKLEKPFLDVESMKTFAIQNFHPLEVVTRYDLVYKSNLE